MTANEIVACQEMKNDCVGGDAMKESVYKTYDELPLFLNSDTVSKLLGISISSAYELMHKKDFPSVRIGNRLIVPKDRFIKWVDQQAG